MALNNVQDNVTTTWRIDTEEGRKQVAELAKKIRVEIKAEKDLALVRKRLTPVTNKLTATERKHQAAIDRLNKSTKKQLAQMKKKQTLTSKGIAKGNLMAAGIKFMGKQTMEALKANNKFVNAQKIYTGNLEEARQATQGLATDLDLMQAQNRLNTLGVKLSSDQHNVLLKGVTKLSNAMGIDMKHGLESAATAMSRQSIMIADNLGIVMSATTANEKYAESIGKTAGSLNANERRLAFQAEFMTQLKEKSDDLPPVLDSVGTNLKKIEVVWDTLSQNFLAWINTSPVFISAIKAVRDVFHDIGIGMGIANTELDNLIQSMKGKEMVRLGRIGGTKAQYLAYKSGEAEKDAQKWLNPTMSNKERKKKMIGRGKDKTKTESNKWGDNALLFFAQIEIAAKQAKDQYNITIDSMAEKTEKYTDNLKETITSEKARRNDFAGMVNGMRDINTESVAMVQNLKELNDVGWTLHASFMNIDSSLNSVYGTIADLGVNAMSSLASSMWEAAEAALAGETTFGKAMQGILKSTLKSVAIQATVLGMMQMAKYIASWFGDIAALKASGMYFATAAVAGASSLAIPGGGGGGGGGDRKKRKNFATERDKPNFTKKRKEVQPLNIEVYIGDPGSPTAALMMQKQISAQLNSQNQSVTSDL